MSADTFKKNDQKFQIYGIGGAIKFGDPGKYFSIYKRM